MADNEGTMTEARTIYAVTSGCYSDYGIVGIFLDKAAAEKCVYMINAGTHHGDDASIEEYVDGKWINMTKILRPLYISAIGLETGEDIESWKEKELVSVTDRTPRYGATSVVWEKFMCDRIKEFHAIGRSYISHEHAHKLAVEARQKFLAEKERNR